MCYMYIDRIEDFLVDVIFSPDLLIEEVSIEDFASIREECDEEMVLLRREIDTLTSLLDEESIFIESDII